MRTKLSGFICLVLFLSVLKGCSTDVCGCVQYDTQVYLNYVDENGDSFFNPDHPNNISQHDIDFFYEKNGNNVSAHSHFSIISDTLTNLYALRFTPNLEAQNQRPVAYIGLKDSVVDTIKVLIKEEDNLTRVTKVWYNSTVRWDSESEENNEENIEYVGRYFEVTKKIE